MSYRFLIDRIIILLSKPKEAWNNIMQEDKQMVFTSFVYPMLALSGLSVFIGSLFSNEGTTANKIFQRALTDASAKAIALFGGVYLVSFLIERFTPRLFSVQIKKCGCQQLVGYGFVIVFVLSIIVGLFPNLKVLASIFQFYIVYIVWEGVSNFIEVKEENKFKVTLFVSFLILCCPWLIEFAFNMLTINLK